MNNSLQRNDIFKLIDKKTTHSKSICTVPSQLNQIITITTSISETTQVAGSGRPRPNRPKPITKAAKGTTNLGRHANNDDINQLEK